jgi:hypothetical protein
VCATIAADKNLPAARPQIVKEIVCVIVVRPALSRDNVSRVERVHGDGGD